MVIRKYAYAWITLGFFLVSFGLHWMFGWFAFVDEARDHRQQPEFNAYLINIGESHLRHHGHAKPHGHGG